MIRIAVFCPNWVGDTVMATPALRALREHYRDAIILGVMRRGPADVLEGLPYFNLRLIWGNKDSRDVRGWRLVRMLRRFCPHLAVLFPNSLRSALVARLSGAKRIVGYARDGRSFLLTDRLRAPRRHGRWIPVSQLEYYLKLTDHLRCPRRGIRLELQTSPRDEEQADEVWRRERLVQARDVVVFNPGAAYGSAKQWPTHYFAELARKFVRLRGTSVLVLCGPGEQATAREIVREAADPRVRSLAAYRPSIGLSKACVRRASLMITTDSGPRHFAAAFDVPVVTLFGPTDMRWSETYFSKAVHLQVPVPCGPCQLRECPLDHRCMTALEPDAVFREALKLWNRCRSVSLRRSA